MELNNEDDKLTPRKRLGRSIRRLREREGLSLRQLSEKVDGFSHSYLGRVELGEQLPSEALVRTLDRFFDTGETLIELWEMVQESLIADYSRSVIKREPEATRIQVFTSSVIPGLLQTEEYARELYRIGVPGLRQDELDERVAIRMRRQRIFEREDCPFYWAILDEAALRRPMKDKRCMREQLQQILRMAEHARISVQVLPFDQGTHSMLGGSLTMLTLRDGKSIALTESFETGKATETADGLLYLNQLFAIAQSMALPPGDSLDIIRRYLKDYENDNRDS